LLAGLKAYTDTAMKRMKQTEDAAVVEPCTTIARVHLHCTACYAPAVGALSDTEIRPSVCPSVCPMAQLPYARSGPQL